MWSLEVTWLRLPRCKKYLRLVWLAPCGGTEIAGSWEFSPEVSHSAEQHAAAHLQLRSFENLHPVSLPYVGLEELVELVAR